MKPDWMPVNACLDCTSKLKGKNCDSYYDCGDKRIEEGGVKHQRKLLEYLTQNVLPFYEAYNTIPNRYTSLKIELKSMLKQLEGKNV